MTGTTNNSNTKAETMKTGDRVTVVENGIELFSSWVRNAGPKQTYLVNGQVFSKSTRGPLPYAQHSRRVVAN